jgi:hypothetical protein
MAELIEFIATLPPIQSAMSVSGNGDGMRIKLDIPESEVPKAIRLMLLANTAFRVQITEIEQGLTKLDDETKKSAEGTPAGVDSRRVDLRRSKQ